MKANNHAWGRVLPPPTKQQIAALAYAIWQDRGCPEGTDIDCWFEAERELKGGTAPAHNGHNGVRDHIPADPINLDRDPAVDGPSSEDELNAVTAPRWPRSPTAL